MAEIANFSAKERKAYYESMKRYREMDNFRDSYRAEGYDIGVIEERERGEEKLEKERRIAVNTMYIDGMPLEKIAGYLNITIDEVKRLLEDT